MRTVRAWSFWLGAGRRFRNLILLTLGTGVGDY